MMTPGTISAVTRLLKRIAGMVTVLVGAFGVIFSVLAIDQAWTLGDRLGRQIPELLGNFEEIVDAVHEQGEATVALLDMTRERVRSLGTVVEDLSIEPEERQTTTILLETLDRDIEFRLSSAEEFIRSMQSSLRSMSNALQMLDSVPFFRPRFPVSDSQHESQLNAVAATLIETADLLDQAQLAITRIRSGQAISPTQVAQLQETLDLVDVQVSQVQTEIRVFTNRVESAGIQMSSLRADLTLWVEYGVILATGFFICFGFTQLSLLIHGLHWLK